MNKMLFRDEATVAMANRLAVAMEHPGLRRPSGLLLLLTIMVVLAFALGVLKVSLGVTALGIVSQQRDNAPILAERGGVLTYVISERGRTNAKKGEVLATIRNMDLSASRYAPSPDFSLQKLYERKRRLEERMNTSREQYQIQIENLNKMKDSMLALSDQTSTLLPLYKEDINRLTEDFRELETAVNRGFVRKAEADTVRNTLRNREVQLQEAQIRMADIRRQMAELEVQRTKITEDNATESAAQEDALYQLGMATQTELDLKSLDLKMPEDGIIQARGYKVGQHVSAEEVLFTRSEDEKAYNFEADIPAAQIGELHKGLPVKISVAAYPYFEHGFIEGTVEDFTQAPNKSISFNEDLPANSNYRVVIRPDSEALSQYCKDKTLIPGMTITVHIKKEKVAVWRLVLAPLLRFQARL